MPTIFNLFTRSGVFRSAIVAGRKTIFIAKRIAPRHAELRHWGDFCDDLRRYLACKGASFITHATCKADIVPAASKIAPEFLHGDTRDYRVINDYHLLALIKNITYK